jgi:hypothetical protein
MPAARLFLKTRPHPLFVSGASFLAAHAVRACRHPAHLLAVGFVDFIGFFHWHASWIDRPSSGSHGEELCLPHFATWGARAARRNHCFI